MAAPVTRAAKLTGLRQLVGQLGVDCALPVPTTVTVEVLAQNDLEGFEAVSRAAHHLGVTATTAANGTQRAAKRFDGGVTLAYVYHPMHVTAVTL